MKANELRIGNFHDNNGVVSVVSPNTIEEVYVAERTWCKPIPLTEEWLLKFGVKLSNNGFTYDKDKISICLPCNSYANGRTYFNSWCIIEKSVEFVHQLQNLYFALTGEELIFSNKK